VENSAIFCCQDLLQKLSARRDLAAEEVHWIFRQVLEGAWSDAETAAVLIALRMKGETAIELAAAAEGIRKQMVKLETGRSDVLDTCGTGGDDVGTFNISTAAAFVVAGAGIPVVKHGNRAVSSRSGSADVLGALGVQIHEGSTWPRRSLDGAGLAFCFAPHFHPALHRVAALRKRLGVRTIFNCLGPLANPASAAYQLLGVGRAELLDPMAGALARLGVRRAFLVCGADGLDEVSLSGPTYVREIFGQTITAHVWHPTDFGLEACASADLVAAGPEESAALVRAVLKGEDIPATRVVIANAAAALLAAERVNSLREGVAIAAHTVQSGRGEQVLENLIRLSRQE
jgi:anthranilate phosphoribosyltransferase